MSCLVPTIQILQPSVTNPILRPKFTRSKTQASTTRPSQQRRKKSYPGDSPSSLSLPRLLPKMRLTAFRNSALFSLLGFTSAQSSQQTWAQTQPFNVDVSTESLLSSATQGLTNIVGTNTPDTTAATAVVATTVLAPAVSITDAFSTTMPTELSTGSSQGSGVVNGTSSRASAESTRSVSVSESVSARANSSATIPSEGAAAPTGVGAGRKVMGVAGVFAGAAGVLFV